METPNIEPQEHLSSFRGFALDHRTDWRQIPDLVTAAFDEFAVGSQATGNQVDDRAAQLTLLDALHDELEYTQAWVASRRAWLGSQEPAPTPA
jgi:hypothetical protein